MTSIQRRLKTLEGIFTDPAGLVPHTEKWLEYWDRQYLLFLTGQDENAIYHGGVTAYRAVMKYAEENPASLVRSFFRDDKAGADDFQTASAA